MPKTEYESSGSLKYCVHAYAAARIYPCVIPIAVTMLVPLLLLVLARQSGGDSSSGPASNQPFELHAADSLTQVGPRTS